MFALSGLAMMAAGVFSADPVDGFPPGTPLGPPTSITTIGLLHFVTALVGFVAWIGACFVFARRFAAQRQRGWVWFSVIKGVFFLVAFLGLATGMGLILAFVVAVVRMFVWISALFLRLKGEVV